jgi:hypothetical protein
MSVSEAQSHLTRDLPAQVTAAKPNTDTDNVGNNIMIVKSGELGQTKLLKECL